MVRRKQSFTSLSKWIDLAEANTIAKYKEVDPFTPQQ